jgi:inner membrane protein
MNPPVPPAIEMPARRRHSPFLKIAGICGLILLLQIPLFLTDGVLVERRGYQRQATAEIAGIWGADQRVTGPVLAIPYAYPTQVIRSKVVAGKVVQVEETDLATATAYFLPETLTAGGPVEPEVRHRGIYDVVVYTTRLRLTGHFRPDFSAAGIAVERIDWQKARVLLGVSDLRGVRSVSPLQFADSKACPFESADSTAGEFLPLVARVENAAADTRLEFAFEVALQGSERLQIAPVGKVTTVALSSSWPDPSFGGACLPVKRSVSSDGFKAEWETSHFSHGFPQSWTSRLINSPEMLRKIDAACFGVTFAQPVDGYRLAERAEKYGLLFFVLVFAMFFLFEVTAALRIHPLQYALVGAALCLFFLGFLALSELMAPGLAYGAAAAACTALVSLYAWSFLRTGLRTLIIGGGLSATYGYLYFVIQSQDYALVAGSAAMFALLALVMFCTRRINWYTLDANPSAPRPVPAAQT